MLCHVRQSPIRHQSQIGASGLPIAGAALQGVENRNESLRCIGCYRGVLDGKWGRVVQFALLVRA